jgi:hypothetical protein
MGAPGVSENQKGSLHTPGHSAFPRHTVFSVSHVPLTEMAVVTHDTHDGGGAVVGALVVVAGGLVVGGAEVLGPVVVVAGAAVVVGGPVVVVGATVVGGGHAVHNAGVHSVHRHV